MKKPLLSSFFVVFLFSGIYAQIQDYQRYFATATPYGQTESLIVLRKWNQGGVGKVLAVDPSTLHTSVRPVNTLQIQAATFQEIRNNFAGTLYIKTLETAYEQDKQLKEVAHTAANRYKTGLDLTIDLCAASGPLDRHFIESILDIVTAEEKPLKLTLSVTGLWMIKNPADMTWLKGLEKSGELQVRWTNHSFHHQTLPQDLTPKIFVPSTVLENDVLQTEKLMLVNGITPSVFFSLPGEVNGPAGFDGAASFGLIGFNCDKWLSRGQPGSGSNIVVLANGNGHFTASLFLETFRNNREKILPWQWICFEM